MILKSFLKNTCKPVLPALIALNLLNPWFNADIGASFGMSNQFEPQLTSFKPSYSVFRYAQVPLNYLDILILKLSFFLFDLGGLV